MLCGVKLDQGEAYDSLSVSLPLYSSPRDKDLAKDVQCMLEYTCLRNIITKAEVW